jgi:hypothetical protein
MRVVRRPPQIAGEFATRNVCVSYNRSVMHGQALLTDNKQKREELLKRFINHMRIALETSARSKRTNSHMDGHRVNQELQRN